MLCLLLLLLRLRLLGSSHLLPENGEAVAGTIDHCEGELSV
jgi:hypothetical protein